MADNEKKGEREAFHANNASARYPKNTGSSSCRCCAAAEWPQRLRRHGTMAAAAPWSSIHASAVCGNTPF
jgi:hypothetical protein